MATWWEARLLPLCNAALPLHEQVDHLRRRVAGRGGNVVDDDLAAAGRRNGSGPNESDRLPALDSNSAAAFGVFVDFLHRQRRVHALVETELRQEGPPLHLDEFRIVWNGKNGL